MKNRNIHKLIRFIILIFFLFAPFYVNAARFTDSDFTLECIYSDGNIYSLSNYKNENGIPDLKVTHTTYPLQFATPVTSQNFGETFYNTNLIQPDLVYRPKTTCQKKLYKESWPKEPPEENVKIDTHVSFGPFGSYVIGREAGCWLFCAKVAVFSTPETAEEYSLVSENIRVSDLDGAEEFFTYYRTEKEEGVTQAAAEKKYVSVYFFSDVTLIEKDKKITKLDGSSNFRGNNPIPLEFYLNQPEGKTMPSYDGRSSISFPAGEVRYSASLTKDARHTIRYQLVQSDEPLTEETEEQICDSISETAKVLQTVIRYVTIIVPVLLIILIALDISRVVFSGNPEEELPKRRKAIVTRIIVAITIFFLPVLVSLLINLIGDAAGNNDLIGQIDCIFSGG